MTDLPRLEEVVVLGLASARLARAISVDEISEPARARLTRSTRASQPQAWATWADRLVRCPLCVGWWTSLVVSLMAPGRHRLLRGVAVAGAQVVLALSERLISEEGRVAIHSADLVAAADNTASPDGDDHEDEHGDEHDDDRADGTATVRRAVVSDPSDLAPHDA